MRRNTLLISVIAGLLLALGLAPPASAAPAFRALLFTKTVGYRHDSIPAGISMFQQQAAANNFELVQTEDSSVFTASNLATFDVIIMFQTSGMVWTSAAQRQAVEGYLASGKGIVGVHNATDMGIESEYPWWDQTMNGGAHMPEHSPGVLQGTAIVADKKHPSTTSLPDRWTPQRGVVQLRHQPARQRPRAGDRRRAHLQPRIPGDGPGPPDLLVPQRRRRAGVGHRDGPRDRLLQRDELPATTSSVASSGQPATPPATAAAPSGATSRSAPWTTTQSTRWRWAWHRTAASSTSSAAAR